MPVLKDSHDLCEKLVGIIRGLCNAPLHNLHGTIKTSGRTTSRPDNFAKKRSVGREIPVEFPGVDGCPVSFPFGFCDVREGLNDVGAQRPADEVVGKKGLVGRVEVPGQRLDPGALPVLGRHMIDVRIDADGGFDLLPDTLHPGGEHRGEGEVGVAGRVRAPELDPGAVAAWRRDPDKGRPVPGAPADVAGRLIPGDQALVGVDRRVRDPGDRLRVPEEAADEVHAGL